MAEADKKWYVLRAVSGKEAKVKEYIEAQMKHEPLLATHVYQVLIPMEKHASIRNGKRIVKEKVSMAGYVFVEASLVGDVAHMLRFVPNVLGFLGGMDAPTPVPMTDINRMLGTADETELVDDVTVPFVVDEAVKVTDWRMGGKREGQRPTDAALCHESGGYLTTVIRLGGRSPILTR